MSRRIRTLIEQQWIGLIALFIALSGTAYAAQAPSDGPNPGVNQVGSLDILDGQVQNADIGDSQVRSGKVRDESLTGADVLNQSLNGNDVLNASLTGDDIADGTIGGLDVASNGLTGNQIMDDSIAPDDINNSLTGTDILDGEVYSVDIHDQTIVGSDIAADTITGGRLAPNSIGTGHITNGEVYSADIHDQTITGADIDEAQVSGLDRCSAATIRVGTICAGSDGNARTWDDAWSYCVPFGLRLPTVGEGQLMGLGSNVPGVNDGEYFWTDEFNGDRDGNLADEVLTVREDGQFSSRSEYVNDLAETVCVHTPYN